MKRLILAAMALLLLPSLAAPAFADTPAPIVAQSTGAVAAPKDRITVTSSLVNPGWVEGTRIGVRTDNAAPYGLVYFNSYYPANGALNLPRGVWTTIDAKLAGVPADALAVDLNGILIITHGTVRESCDLHLALRKVGDTLPCDYYIGQTVEMEPGNGQRSNMSSWVPVVNGEFQACWTGTTTIPWPDSCAYGTTLHVQSYVAP